MADREVRFSPELLVSLCRGTYRIVESPVPDGAGILSVRVDGPHDEVSIRVRHPDLPASDEPLLPIIERADTGGEGS